MPEKIGLDTPLELTPEGLVRQLCSSPPGRYGRVFTLRELMFGERIIARGSWRSCTLQMKGVSIEETRIIGKEGSAEFNVESRNCGILEQFLAEHGLVLSKTAPTAVGA